MSQIIQERLAAVRAEMAKSGLDAFIVPRADEYLGEYVPARNERLRWLSGFSGSAGMAIVLKDSAVIFVDGRYTVQVRQQVSAELFSYSSLQDDPPPQWLAAHLPEGSRVGYDPRMHTLGWQRKALSILGKKRIALLAVADNPVDLHWYDRPAAGKQKIMLFDEASAGKSSQQKRLEIGAAIAQAGADAALISAPDSFCWLLNIRGRDVPRFPVVLGTAILKANGDMTLLVDPDKLPAGMEAHVGDGVTFMAEADTAAALRQLGRIRLLADPDAANVWSQSLAEEGGAQLVAGPDPVALPKAQKNAAELAGIRACHIRDGVAVSRFLAWLDAQVALGRLHDEAILADQLHSYRLQDPLYQDPSFDTISAAGSNAAMCHYNHQNATPARLTPDSLYLVDSGAQYLDGTTDVTRTVAIGEVSAEMKKMTTLVLKGHIALAQMKFPAGTSGQQLDAFARQYLWQHGYDYDHGTGHGVGHFLSVHEGPQRIAKNANGVALLPGMVVSNEPGYYRAGAFGIRLENLVTVRPCLALAGAEREMLEFETLTFIPIDRRLIDTALLNENEIDWFNAYQQSVFAALAAHMTGDDLAWLTQATRAI